MIAASHIAADVLVVAVVVASISLATILACDMLLSIRAWRGRH